MAGVAFAVEGDGVGFATESYAASALYTTLASLSGALWRIRRARKGLWVGGTLPLGYEMKNGKIAISLQAMADFGLNCARTSRAIPAAGNGIFGCRDRAPKIAGKARERLQRLKFEK
jgi:hypothetical protein